MGVRWLDGWRGWRNPPRLLPHNPATPCPARPVTLPAATERCARVCEPPQPSTLQREAPAGRGRSRQLGGSTGRRQQVQDAASECRAPCAGRPATGQPRGPQPAGRSGGHGRARGARSWRLARSQAVIDRRSIVGDAHECGHSKDMPKEISDRKVIDLLFDKVGQGGWKHLATSRPGSLPRPGGVEFPANAGHARAQAPHRGPSHRFSLTRS